MVKYSPLSACSLDDIVFRVRVLCPHERIELFERLLRDCAFMELRFVATLVESLASLQPASVVAVEDDLAPLWKLSDADFEVTTKRFGENLDNEKVLRKVVILLIYLSARAKAEQVKHLASVLTKIPEAVEKIRQKYKQVSTFMAHEMYLLCSLACCHPAFGIAEKHRLREAFDDIKDVLEPALGDCDKDSCIIQQFSEETSVPINLPSQKSERLRVGPSPGSFDSIRIDVIDNPSGQVQSVSIPTRNFLQVLARNPPPQLLRSLLPKPKDQSADNTVINQGFQHIIQKTGLDVDKIQAYLSQTDNSEQIDGSAANNSPQQDSGTASATTENTEQLGDKQPDNISSETSKSLEDGCENGDFAVAPSVSYYSRNRNEANSSNRHPPGRVPVAVVAGRRASLPIGSAVNNREDRRYQPCQYCYANGMTECVNSDTNNGDNVDSPPRPCGRGCNSALSAVEDERDGAPSAPPSLNFFHIPDLGGNSRVEYLQRQASIGAPSFGGKSPGQQSLLQQPIPMPPLHLPPPPAGMPPPRGWSPATLVPSLIPFQQQHFMPPHPMTRFPYAPPGSYPIFFAPGGAFPYQVVPSGGEWVSARIQPPPRESTCSSSSSTGGCRSTSPPRSPSPSVSHPAVSTDATPKATAVVPGVQADNGLANEQQQRSVAEVAPTQPVIPPQIHVVPSPAYMAMHQPGLPGPVMQAFQATFPYRPTNPQMWPAMTLIAAAPPMTVSTSSPSPSTTNTSDFTASGDGSTDQQNNSHATAPTGYPGPTPGPMPYIIVPPHLAEPFMPPQPHRHRDNSESHSSTAGGECDGATGSLPPVHPVPIFMPLQFPRSYYNYITRPEGLVFCAPPHGRERPTAGAFNQQRPGFMKPAGVATNEQQPSPVFANTPLPPGTGVYFPMEPMDQHRMMQPPPPPRQCLSPNVAPTPIGDPYAAGLNVPPTGAVVFPNHVMRRQNHPSQPVVRPKQLVTCVRCGAANHKTESCHLERRLSLPTTGGGRDFSIRFKSALPANFDEATEVAANDVANSKTAINFNDKLLHPCPSSPIAEADSCNDDTTDHDKTVTAS